jgi:hypothetical protein
LLSARPNAVADLAALTQLRDLVLRVTVTANDVAGFGVRDLLPLTALTGLTRLCSYVKQQAEEGEEEEEDSILRGASEPMVDLEKHVSGHCCCFCLALLVCLVVVKRNCWRLGCSSMPPARLALGSVCGFSRHTAWIV